MLLTKLEIYIDEKILKLYIKTNNKLLKKYLEKRTKHHTKCVCKDAKDLFKNGSDETKIKVIKMLKDMIGEEN